MHDKHYSRFFFLLKNKSADDDFLRWAINMQKAIWEKSSTLQLVQLKYFKYSYSIIQGIEIPRSRKPKYSIKSITGSAKVKFLPSKTLFQLKIAVQNFI